MLNLPPIYNEAPPLSSFPIIFSAGSVVIPLLLKTLYHTPVNFWMTLLIDNIMVSFTLFVHFESLMTTVPYHMIHTTLSPSYDNIHPHWQSRGRRPGGLLSPFPNIFFVASVSSHSGLKAGRGGNGVGIKALRLNVSIWRGPHPWWQCGTGGNWVSTSAMSWWDWAAWFEAGPVSTRLPTPSQCSRDQPNCWASVSHGISEAEREGGRQSQLAFRSPPRPCFLIRDQQEAELSSPPSGSKALSQPWLTLCLVWAGREGLILHLDSESMRQCEQVTYFKCVLVGEKGGKLSFHSLTRKRMSYVLL